MRLGVCKRKRASPGPTEYDPALDPEVGPDLLHVLDQIPGRVVLEAGARSAATAAALIEKHDAVGIRVEESALRRRGSAARPAVDENDRLAIRTAALLDVDVVQIGNLYVLGQEWLDGRIEVSHGGQSSPASDHRFGQRIAIKFMPSR